MTSLPAGILPEMAEMRSALLELSSQFPDDTRAVPQSPPDSRPSLSSSPPRNQSPAEEMARLKQASSRVAALCCTTTGRHFHKLVQLERMLQQFRRARLDSAVRGLHQHMYREVIRLQRQMHLQATARDQRVQRHVTKTRYSAACWLVLQSCRRYAREKLQVLLRGWAQSVSCCFRAERVELRGALEMQGAALDDANQTLRRWQEENEELICHNLAMAERMEECSMRCL